MHRYRTHTCGDLRTANVGETVRLVDHLRGIDTRVEVVSPVFYDPEGGRMRG